MSGSKMKELWQAIIKSAIGLSIFAIVTAGLIAITQLSTAKNIELAQKRARARALLEIVPANEHDNDMLESTINLDPDPLLGNADNTEAFLAKRGTTPVAVILPFTTPDGYTGDIKAIVGIRPDGTIKGVRITGHKETPGLGDKIELRKSPWILGFNDKSLQKPDTAGWKVRKDGGEFDQLTGATITPRAVVSGIRKALEYFQIHRQQLLNLELILIESETK
jgi:Na+-translocating ferredoxin:NAD+ oxidoreductase subunit G